MIEKRPPSILFVGQQGSLPEKVHAGGMPGFQLNFQQTWPSTAGSLRTAARATLICGAVDTGAVSILPSIRRLIPRPFLLTVASGPAGPMVSPISDLHFHSALTAEELSQMIRVLVTRHCGPTAELIGHTEGYVGEKIELEHWTVWPQRFRAESKAGRKVEHLAKRTVSLLRLFVTNPNKSFDRQHLVLLFGGENLNPKSRVIDQYLLQVRRLLGKDRFKHLPFGHYAYLPTGQFPLSDEAGKELAQQ